MKTETLGFGFPDENEAIQLGLMVPKNLESKDKDSLELENPKHPVKTENANNENQLEKSELSVFSLKSYTQITESTVDKQTQQGETSKEAIHESNKNLQVGSNECSIKNEVPVQNDNVLVSQTSSSPDTCSQVDKVKNAQDKMNGSSGEVQKGGIIVNPHCCEDKLLPGYCGYEVKNINEGPKNFKLCCCKQQFLHTCYFCM